MGRSNGGSFSGRTTDSDSVNPGSNPGPPAIDSKGLAGFSVGPFSLKILDCARNCARLQSLIPRVAPSEGVFKYTAGREFIDFYHKSILLARPPNARFHLEIENIGATNIDDSFSQFPILLDMKMGMVAPGGNPKLEIIAESSHER